MASRGDRVDRKAGNWDKHPFVYPSPDEAQRYRGELEATLKAMRERRSPCASPLPTCAAWHSVSTSMGKPPNP